MRLKQEEDASWFGVCLIDSRLREGHRLFAAKTSGKSGSLSTAISRKSYGSLGRNTISARHLIVETIESHGEYGSELLMGRLAA